MNLLNKNTLLVLCMFLFSQLFGQESKIENYKKWKYVSELLTAVQDSGVVLLRIQDFENGKNYIKRNYESSTYNLYINKIDKYNRVLKEDVSKGFTFSKIYVFNSKLSKHILNDEFEKIEFINPKNGNVNPIDQSTPHIFAQIKSLKLSGNSNPLNFSYQRLIQVLDRDLQKHKDIDLQQDFFYHSNVKGKDRCTHIFEAAQKMSKSFEELLVLSKKKQKRLKKQIKAKHVAKIEEFKKKINTMLKIKEGSITNQHRSRLNNEIEKFRNEINKIELIEKQLFEL